MNVSIDVVREFLEQTIPFNRFLGLKITKFEAGSVRFEIPFRDELIGNPYRPSLHGGVISALADTCGGIAVWTEMEPGDRTSTIDLRIDFLRPGPSKDIACEATVLRIGERVGVAQMRVFAVDEPDVTLAVGKGVYAVKRMGKTPEEAFSEAKNV